jgi:hypothetical protein
MFEQEGKEEHGDRANPKDHAGIQKRHGGGLHHEPSIDLGNNGRLRSSNSQPGAALPYRAIAGLSAAEAALFATCSF